MSTMIIARRYAKALFDSSGSGKSEAIYVAMSEIAAFIEQDPLFKGFIHNPLLSFEEQEKILKALFTGKIPDDFQHFLLFLTYKGRLNLLKETALAYEQMYLETQGQAKALVQSAYPLSDQIKTELLAKLKTITHKTIVASYEVFAPMIGGIRIYAGGNLYEYGFKNELQDYKRKALQRI